VNINLSHDKFLPGQFAIIDKGNIGGRHLKLSDGESLIYVEAGSRCTVIKEVLHGEWVIVELDTKGARCEINSKDLSHVRQRTPMQIIDLYSLTGIIEEEG
jgi:hypothetical protein